MEQGLQQRSHWNKGQPGLAEQRGTVETRVWPYCQSRETHGSTTLCYYDHINNGHVNNTLS